MNKESNNNTIGRNIKSTVKRLPRNNAEESLNAPTAGRVCVKVHIPAEICKKIRATLPKSAPFDAEDLLVMRLFDAGAVDAALKDITDMEQKVATMLSDFAREHNISLKPPRTRS